MIDNTDEKDIELMFAEARRYDLLTAEQEQSIDSTKWSAVREIYALISESDELVAFTDESIDFPNSTPFGAIYRLLLLRSKQVVTTCFRKHQFDVFFVCVVDHLRCPESLIYLYDSSRRLPSKNWTMST